MRHALLLLALVVAPCAAQQAGHVRDAPTNRSLVRHVFDHRLRSGDQRTGRRRAVARVWRRRRRAVRQAGRRRRRDAGVGQPPVRPQGDRAARAGAVAGRSRQAHHRRGSRAATRARWRSSTRRAARRSTPASASSIATPIRRIPCISAATPATSPARTSPRRATRSPASRSSRRWPPRIEQGKGSMAERLMDALDAGQSKGGDTRGMQSAGILVVRPLAPNSNNTVERIVDIRVDDHENPFKELRRLLNMTHGRPQPADRERRRSSPPQGKFARGDRRAAEGARDQPAQRAGALRAGAALRAGGRRRERAQVAAARRSAGSRSSVEAAGGGGSAVREAARDARSSRNWCQ